MRARVAICSALLIVLALPAGASALEVGISDQQASAWQDSRLRALGIGYARLTVPWDAATSEPAKVQAWLAAVAAAGARPHVAFQHLNGDRCPSSPCTVPSRTTYGKAVRAFLARFPQVSTFTFWNEANHSSQPVASRPETAAGYYDELRLACPACTVVAGDVLDSGSYVSWLERFAAVSDSSPRLWGLHNYGDVTYGTTSRTDAALAAVEGTFWIEETGGIVTRRSSAGRVLFSASETDAAGAIDNAFAIAAARSRIARMYVYQWKAWPRDTFDSGLVRPDGVIRPSYYALQRNLGSGAGDDAPTAPIVTLRWSARWSKKGRLVVRATCRTSDRRCRGRVTIGLRTRARAASSTRLRRLAVRGYRTSGSKRSAVLSLRVSAALRRHARRSARRWIKLTVAPTLPAGARSTVVVRLARPR